MGSDEDWQRWSPKVAVGPPLEEVLLIRDENANLVWGIEHTIRMPTGEPHRGSEASAEVLAYRRRRSGSAREPPCLQPLPLAGRPRGGMAERPPRRGAR